MSYTEVYAAFEDGDLVSLGECHNSFRGATWVWRELAKKHLFDGRDDPWEIGPLMMGDGVKRIWRLDEELNDTEWYVLMSTFDGVLVPPDLMLAVADALEAFEPGTENLSGQARLIREAHSKGARAIAWNQTSVSCSPWSIWNEETEEARAFNIDRDIAEPIYALSDRRAWWMPTREAYREDRAAV